MIVHGPHSVRVYVRGRRIHHGLTGAVMAAVGALLLIHDWKDRPWSFYDDRTRRAR